MQLTEKEMEIFSDREFLILKTSIIDKIKNHFEEVRVELKKIISSTDLKFPDQVDMKIGKIFKGENYESLPYVVLDYPKFYSDTYTFSFRTMFWWGNFFSSTLHLQGESLNTFRPIIFSNAEKLIDKNLFICVNDSPWDYHYRIDNYQLLDRNNLDLINSVDFLKLSKKFELNEYDQIPLKAADYLKFCIEILNS